jgi:leader peptidase (prepilin peptidase) / N-methyltransferase
MFFMSCLAFVFGAAVGSFLNVCIFRLPLKTSIIKPASRCPHCLVPLHYYDNIPLISFIILRGKCRNCGGKISWRYPLVELLTALLSVMLFVQFGPTVQFLTYFVFFAVLIVITFIDLDHQIIPDILSLPGIPIFFLASVFLIGLPWKDALFGVLIGGGVLLAIALSYELITKREGMGGGDIKLLAMIGGFLGWKSLLFILLFSSLFGAIVGFTLIIVKNQDMKYAVPFGPFLAVAVVVYVFWGKGITNFLYVRY